jgi:hypothetical protein
MLKAIGILWACLAFALPASAEVCSVVGPGKELPSAEPATRLAVVLHGLTLLGPLNQWIRRDEGPQAMEGLAAAIHHAKGGYEATDVLIPELPFSPFSIARPDDILICLLKLIDERWRAKRASGQPYKSVLLVGHSMGSLYARKLYVLARGQTLSAPFESSLAKAGSEAELTPALDQQREWGTAVDRIVLLAGINRGWSVDHHMPFERMAWMHLGLIVNRVAQALGIADFTVMSTRKGAPFVTQLRLQWLAMKDCAAPTACPPPPPPHVAQLLGTQDDLVPPEDYIDLTVGNSFAYHTVPHTNHADVVKMKDEDKYASARAEKFIQALTKTKGDHRPEALDIRAAADPTVKHVVFVMHGIRDEGFWTERLGATIRKRFEVQGCTEANECKVRLEVSSYGYFPMLSFLKPGARNEKVEWLMDRYTEAKARYPNAKFYYVGHSHGTYLLKEALENYEAVRFDRAVLAGSVMRSDHAWPDLIAAKRVDSVLNLSASADWVVAFFPNAMQKLNWQDMGGAGFYGFEKKDERLLQVADKLWVKGGHGAAVAENWWGSIADFVASDPPSFTPPENETEPIRDCFILIGGYIAPLLWVAIAALLFTGLRLIIRSHLREWAKTTAVVAYFWAIWFVLTTV